MVYFGPGLYKTVQSCSRGDFLLCVSELSKNPGNFCFDCRSNLVFGEKETECIWSIIFVNLCQQKSEYQNIMNQNTNTLQQKNE